MGAMPLERLLALWGQSPAAPRPLAERVGDMLNWTDAVLLSQALVAAPAAASASPAALAAARDWAAAALERLGAELAAGFADPLLARDAATPLAQPDLPLNDLLAPYRLHHAQQQRGIAVRVAGLRERLRARLVQTGSPRLTQLAQLDAVFDRALVERQQQALAALPGLLFGHRAAAHQTQHATRWPARLWVDLQQLLAAELAFRLQPVLGLIEALQAEPEPLQPRRAETEPLSP
jgi:hypothetical protein